MRAFVGQMPAGDDDPTPVANAPALDTARIAVVTTAGLRVGDDLDLLEMGDPSFVEIACDATDLRIAHFSPNFDRSGFTLDVNVVFPIDRLRERAEDGRLGSVNDRHLSFMGAQADLSTIIHDTGPAAAQLLVDDGVDVVLLTPI